ncbi:hypothetical protein JCGZ_07601 [Jatropha curcas]|uniref:DUF7880 domain-containing protein n=1 Tax=Jatropha curcas TaxID=180498 RepID=A0A067KP06_JATCU|nr:uncharacterized protein LOC105638085 [Jatropha curcas]KDP34030.1 hypothetical protein JCGZ_07601 [Jatropha curcas]
MPTPHSAAHVSVGPLNPSAFPLAFSSKDPRKKKSFSQVRCALSSPRWRETNRRLVSISLLLSHIFPVPNHAIAANFLDKYVKKKKLDPLEAYVPAVILTQLQIKDLVKILEVDQPQFANYRSLLRSGPAASLRVNIRAVAQYASDAGSGNTAFNDVDLCLRALEELDSLLLRASRNDPEASVKSMKEKVGVALNSLDSLLRTVPRDILDQGKAIADAYRSPQEEDEPEILDPELKELESIL